MDRLCSRSYGLVAALVATALAHDGRAEPPNAPGYAFGAPAGEVSLSVAAVLSLGSYLLPQHRTAWGPSPARPPHQGYSLVSDFTGSVIGSTWQIVGSYALESSYLAEHGADAPERRAFRTALVDLQSTLLTTGITLAIKRATGRCRPRSWRNGRCGPDPEHNSFPSGHTSLGSAVAGSRFVIAAASDGDPTKRYLAFGFAEAATVATAVLRVLAGAHSWEDVLVGWGIGHATGSLVALAHPMEAAEQLGSTQASLVAPVATSVSWRGRF